jgi:hypothetical protein
MKITRTILALTIVFVVLVIIIACVAGDENPVIEHPRSENRQEQIDFVVTHFTNSNVFELENVVTSLTEISFTLRNNSNQLFGYGSFFELARYENGDWIAVSYIPELVAWTSILYTLPSGMIRSYSFDLEWLFGVLEPGRYKFFREYFHLDDEIRFSEFSVREYVMVEFIVG